MGSGKVGSGSMSQFAKNLTHKATAYAQVILSVIFLGGYFWTLYDFVHGNIKVPTDWKETLQTLLTVLTVNVTQIVSYWFSRHRDSKNDQPNDS